MRCCLRQDVDLIRSRHLLELVHMAMRTVELVRMLGMCLLAFRVC